MRQIRIADLRHLITVQYLDPEAGEDEYGAPISAWVNLGRLWSMVEPLTGREYFAAQQLQAEITHRITTRYHPGWHTAYAFITPAQLVPASDQMGVSPQCRITLGSRAFDILSVVDLEERHRWLELRCREKVA